MKAFGTGGDERSAAQDILKLYAQPEAEAKEETAEEDQPIVESETEEVETDEVDAQEDESDDDSDDTEEDVFEVKVNGETKEVSFSDLVSNYQKGENYQKKMEEISGRVNSEVESKLNELGSNLREQQTKLIEETTFLEGLYGQPVVTEEKLQELLADGDVEEFQKLKYQEENRQKLVGQLKAKQSDALSALQKQADQEMQKFKKKETVALFEKLPELQKEDNQKKLAQYLKVTGFSDDEIGGFADHRGLIIAEKARKYDELIASSKGKKVKSKSPKPIRKVGKGAQKEAQGKKVRNEGFAKLKKSGSTRDAGKLIEQLLSNKG